jgi:hypothetical protein
MDFEAQCGSCAHQDTCSRIYEKMGKSKGPNVTLQVILAFVLPVIVVVAGYLLFDSSLAEAIKNEKLRTLASLFAAICSLIIYLWLLALTGISKKTKKIKKNENSSLKYCDLDKGESKSANHQK